MYILKSQRSFDDKSNDNLIEIIGMPASGKSTLLRKMAKEDNKIVNVNEFLMNSSFKRQLYKTGSIFACFIKSPLMFINDCKIIISSGQRSIKDLLIVLSNWFLIVNFYQNYNKADTKNIYIWDQGLFQALWSIVFSGSKSFDMLMLFDKKVLPNKVYLTDVDNDTLIKRALYRNTPIRLDYRSEFNIDKGREALDQVIECLNKIGYVKDELDR